MASLKSEPQESGPEDLSVPRSASSAFPLPPAPPPAPPRVLTPFKLPSSSSSSSSTTLAAVETLVAPRPLLSDVPHGLPTVVQTLNVVAPSAGLLKDDGRDENQNVAGFVAALQQQQQPQPQQLLQQTIDSHNNPAPSVTYALGGVDLAEVATSAPARFPSAAPRDYYARVAGDQQTVRVLAPSSIKTVPSAEPLAERAQRTYFDKGKRFTSFFPSPHYSTVTRLCRTKTFRRRM